MVWSQYLQENRERFLDEFLEYLRIPSLSTDPAHQPDVRRAAEWTAQRMRQAGIEAVSVMDTDGHPVVYGEWLHATGKPTVLIYGHFDVQPPDPLELWTAPPFEPRVADGRVYARGASDMKGNVLMTIIACEALLKTAGALPVNLKFLIEGEEEIGSPNLPAFIAANRERLSCDLAVSADSTQYSEEQPALLVGLRGLSGLQIDVKTAATDLHSGIYGGIAPNALQVLAGIIASLKGADGRILVPGFYDDVLPLTEADRAMMAAIPDDTEELAVSAGLKQRVGEPGYTPRQRNWARPTLDVNGIWGGFQGEGIKTVIPCEAHAKVTCRLVANQDPDRILALLKAHIAAQTPPEAEVSVRPLPGRADPYLIPADHPGMAAATRVLTKLYGRAPYHVRFGATVPVTAQIQKLLDAYTVQFGFGLLDERQHAPDEFMRIANFERGQDAYCLLLEELGR